MNEYGQGGEEERNEETINENNHQEGQVHEVSEEKMEAEAESAETRSCVLIDDQNIRRRRGAKDRQNTID